MITPFIKNSWFFLSRKIGCEFLGVRAGTCVLARLCPSLSAWSEISCRKLGNELWDYAGSGLHLELTLLHRIGLSPREAIAAATSNFADIYGWRDIGRIEPGRVADVLILNADPRSDLAALDHIDRIIFRGAVLHRQSLLEARDMK